MKLFVLTFITLLSTAWTEQRPATATPQDKRELNFAATDKQAYASVSPAPATYSTAAPPLYKVSAQTFSPQKTAAIPASQALTYNPQSLSYTPQAISYIPQAAFKYAHAPVSLPAQVSYGFASPSQQIDYSAQPVAFAQPVAKLGTASTGPKYISAPAPEPAPAPIQFSPASEVSSFKFSSPLVTYSNLGVLSQITGKIGETSQIRAHPTPTAHVASTPQVAYSTAPQKAAQAAAQQQLAYSAAPQVAYNTQQAVPTKFAYAPVPQQYSFVASPQQIAYSAAPQKVLYAAQAAAPQKLVYATQAAAPQKLVYSAQAAAAPKFVYAPAPARQYVASNQQVLYAPQQYTDPSSQQRVAYAIAAPQGSHSVPQAVYVQAPSQFQSEDSADAY